MQINMTKILNKRYKKALSYHVDFAPRIALLPTGIEDRSVDLSGQGARSCNFRRFYSSLPFDLSPFHWQKALLLFCSTRRFPSLEQSIAAVVDAYLTCHFSKACQNAFQLDKKY